MLPLQRALIWKRNLRGSKGCANFIKFRCMGRVDFWVSKSSTRQRFGFTVQVPAPLLSSSCVWLGQVLYGAFKPTYFFKLIRMSKIIAGWWHNRVDGNGESFWKQGFSASTFNHSERKGKNTGIFSCCLLRSEKTETFVELKGAVAAGGRKVLLGVMSNRCRGERFLGHEECIVIMRTCDTVDSRADNVEEEGEKQEDKSACRPSYNYDKHHQAAKR